MNFSKDLFIGVDGGATKCIVRLEDAKGTLLGEEISGPANIRISVDQTWESINTALNKILKPLNIQLSEKQYQFHAGMGLAGSELPEAYGRFLQLAGHFTTLVVSSDAYTACLGAHNGADGSIIIIGTGVAGFQIQNGKTKKIAGWGFPHDDEGGGAWLGLQAIKSTLKWLDGRIPESALARAVFARFNDNHVALVSWANQSNSTAYAELAPLVIQQAQANDEVAINIMRRAALAIDHIDDALDRMQSAPLPCSLIGSVAPHLMPYLGSKLQSKLKPCQLSPEVGAILLVRQHLRAENKS